MYGANKKVFRYKKGTNMDTFSNTGTKAILYQKSTVLLRTNANVQENTLAVKGVGSNLPVGGLNLLIQGLNLLSNYRDSSGGRLFA
jgi:hypothetical protein